MSEQHLSHNNSSGDRQQWRLQTKGFLEECNVDAGQGEGDSEDEKSEPEEDDLVLHVVEVDRLPEEYNYVMAGVKLWDKQLKTPELRKC